MGLTPTSAPRNFNTPIEDYSPTILESITRAPFSMLNAPSNAVKSLIRAVKDQNLSDVGNAVASLIPFAGSEDVPASDITGTDDWISNLAFDTITDPLMLVGGVGTLTKTGKAAELVSSRTLAVKALEKLGTVEEVAKAKLELDAAKEMLVAAKVAKPSEPARNIIKVLGQDVGDFESVKKLAGKVNPMPDIRRAEYVKELGRVSRKLEKGVKEEGEIYYHGTTKAFDKFNTSTVFGSTDPKVAQGYGAANAQGLKGGALFGQPDNIIHKNISIRPFKLSKDARILDTKNPKYKKIKNYLDDVAETREEANAYLLKEGYDAIRNETATQGTIIRVSNPDVIVPYSSHQFTPKRAELLSKASKLNEELQGLNKGIIPLPIAEKLRSTLKTATALFKHSGNNELLETGRDVMMSNIARDSHLIQKEAAELITNVNTMAEQKGITALEQLTRLTRGKEFRNTLTEGMPDIAAVVTEKSGKAYERYLSRLEKAGGDVGKQADAFQRFKVAINKYKIQGEETRLEHLKFLEETKANPYTVAELAAIDALTTMSEDLPHLEKSALLISEPLTSSRGLIEYTRRLYTPQAKALKLKDSTTYNLMQSEIKTRIKSAMRRKLYPEKDLITINEILKDTLGLKFDVFDPNIVKGMMNRRLESVEAINRSQYVQFAIENMATDTKLGKKEGYSVERFIHKLNGSRLPQAGKYDAKAFAGKYPGKYISKSDADEILHVHSILRNSLFNNNEGVGKVMGAVDKYINAPFRVALTNFFPGYHNRNAIGNSALRIIGGEGPINQIKFSTQAGKLQHAIATNKATPAQVKLWEELVQWGIPGKGMNSELNRLFEQYGVQEGSKVSNLLERPVSGLFGRTKGVDPMTGRAWGRYIEDNARIGHYLFKKSQGSTPLEAMRSVNKYLFDFTKLTDFEKKFARPTVLFYTWMRNNIPLQMKTVITNPRLLEVYNNITGQNNEDVPAYLRGASAFKNPLSEGSVVGSLGLPVEDLNFANIAAADPDLFSQISALADKFVTRLSPAFRIPYEVAAGRTTFGRKSLSNLSPAGLLKEFTPVSRAITSAEKLTDPENTWTETFVDLLSGVRTYNVNENRVAIDKIKRALLKSGKFQRSGFLVLPKEEYKEEKDVKKASHKLQKAIRKLRKD